VVSLLERYGINLRDLRYEMFPTKFVSDSVSASDKFESLDFVSKARSAVLYELSSSSMPMDHDYTWVKNFKYVFTDLIKPIEGEFHPMMSLCKSANEMYRHIGLIKSTSRNTIKPALILSILRADPFFRRDLRDESIIEILSSPKLFGNRDLIELVLIGVGARADLAAQVAEMFLDRSASFVFRASISGISLKDAAASNLDLSLENHYRIVDMPPLPNRDLRELIVMHAFALAVSNGLLTGQWRHVRVEIGQDSEYRSMSTLLGNLYQKASKFLRTYPKAEWEDDPAARNNVI